MTRFVYFPTIYYVQRDLWKRRKQLRYPPFKVHVGDSVVVAVDFVVGFIVDSFVVGVTVIVVFVIDVVLVVVVVAVVVVVVVVVVVYHNDDVYHWQAQLEGSQYSGDLTFQSDFSEARRLALAMDLRNLNYNTVDLSGSSPETLGHQI